MIWVIDTSTNPWDSAVLEDGQVVAQYGSTLRPKPARYYEVVLAQYSLSKIAVATGPGSFTGTRIGVSFAVGLAMGLGIPIVPLPSLDLQAARTDVPVTAASDAGRGRLYYQVPGGRPALGDPSEVPTAYPIVGVYPVKTDTALRETGHVILTESEIPRSFGQAAAKLVETAPEVPYRNLEIEYMQSFSPRKV